MTKIHCIIFLLVTGLKCSYRKISSPLTEIPVGKTEISATEPARSLIWTRRNFLKGSRDVPRSRKPGQPGQPGSYEEALSCENYIILRVAVIKSINSLKPKQSEIIDLWTVEVLFFSSQYLTKQKAVAKLTKHEQYENKRRVSLIRIYVI